ncbi:MAG: hypothetical protein MGG11_18820 [Trichodesmium sp. MAG_R03]|nr:hypothetical protein [Trichodesmium sp. MAG_R03]
MLKPLCINTFRFNQQALFMPLAPEVTINAVCNAVTQGHISESRIDQSLQSAKNLASSKKSLSYLATRK